MAQGNVVVELVAEDEIEDTADDDDGEEVEANAAPLPRGWEEAPLVVAVGDGVSPFLREKKGEIDDCTEVLALVKYFLLEDTKEVEVVTDADDEHVDDGRVGVMKNGGGLTILAAELAD